MFRSNANITAQIIDDEAKIAQPDYRNLELSEKLKTEVERIKANAKRIESYEELCEVVARYNELQNI